MYLIPIIHAMSHIYGPLERGTVLYGEVWNVVGNGILH